MGISCPSRILCIPACGGLPRVFGAGTVYAPWFAAAATRQVCKFVTVEASVGSSRFGVEAVVASEERTVGFAVSCVCLVAEGGHYGAVVGVVQGASCD